MHTEIPKWNPSPEKVFSIHNEKDFHSIALSLFQFQFAHNPVYGAYCTALGRHPGNVETLEEIPFLPISFFKTNRVSTSTDAETVFMSSGTTGITASRHYVKDLSLYRQSFFSGFRRFFGDPAAYCIVGLLPSYLERGQSSLVYMVNHLIQETAHPLSGFYLNELDKLEKTLEILEEKRQKTILFGVTYALLDFARDHPRKLRHTLIMDTGGMKGRRREMIRAELNGILKESFETDRIYSEYGMTELLSQAYAVDGLFSPPPWMKVGIREETDPLSVRFAGGEGLSGAVNIIDLANIHACAFIATGDVGRLHGDGTFEILGRLDHDDLRGCSLLTV